MSHYLKIIIPSYLFSDLRETTNTQSNYIETPYSANQGHITTVLNTGV